MHSMITRWTLPAVMATGLVAGAPLAALAQSATTPATSNQMTTQGSVSTNASTNNAPNTGEAVNAQKLVAESATNIQKMERDPKLKKYLAEAKGVYIVPDFAKGGLVVGGWGGEGVLMLHQNGKWIGPAFYNMGAVSAGAEVGFEAGTVAYLLMSNDAVKEFQTDNTFALNATSDLTIVNYSAADQAAVGKGAVIVWASTSGIYGGLSGSVSNVTWDSEKNNGFYGKTVSADQIMSGDVTAPAEAASLKQALPS